MTWDPLASTCRKLTISRFWLAEQTALAFISHVLMQLYTKPVDVHDGSLANGSADVLGYEVSPASACCSGTGQRISRTRSVARTVSSRRRISGRVVELVSGHESFFLCAQQSWCSLNPWMPASNMRGGLIWFQESHGQLCEWNFENSSPQ